VARKSRPQPPDRPNLRGQAGRVEGTITAARKRGQVTHARQIQRSAKTARTDSAKARQRTARWRNHPGRARRSWQNTATASAVEPVMEVRKMQLVTQRKPLEEVEPIWLLRWLLRRYFEWRGFACRSHCGKCDGKCYASIEYRGVFDDDAMAYHAARCKGGAVKPIPFNAALPEETVCYEVGDVPLSEASPWYRRGVMLPFVPVPRNQMERLRKKIRDTDPIIEEMRAKAV